MGNKLNWWNIAVTLVFDKFTNILKCMGINAEMCMAFMAVKPKTIKFTATEFDNSCKSW